MLGPLWMFVRKDKENHSNSNFPRIGGPEFCPDRKVYGTKNSSIVLPRLQIRGRAVETHTDCRAWPILFRIDKMFMHQFIGFEVPVRRWESI
jgi:hypothetical protein